MVHVEDHLPRRKKGEDRESQGCQTRHRDVIRPQLRQVIAASFTGISYTFKIYW